MAVTLKDIAKNAGVSKSTVSEILCSNSTRYRQETREKVFETARRFGYRPNASARAVCSGRYGCVGFLTGSEAGFSGFSSELVMELHRPLEEKNIRLVFSSLADEKLTDEEFMAGMQRSLGVDGLLVNYLAKVPSGLERMIDEFSIPSIWLNYKKTSDSIYFNDYNGAEKATEYLLDLKHQRIAFLQFSYGKGTGYDCLHYSVLDRQGGYSSAMEKANLLPWIPLPNIRLNPIGARAFVTQLLSQNDRPTAIITYNPDVMQTVLIVAAELSIKIPEELSVITFDQEIYDEMGIEVTTMLLDTKKLGNGAAQMLLQKLDKPKKEIPSTVINSQMLIGKTCAEANA